MPDGTGDNLWVPATLGDFQDCCSLQAKDELQVSCCAIPSRLATAFLSPERKCRENKIAITRVPLGAALAM